MGLGRRGARKDYAALAKGEPLSDAEDEEFLEPRKAARGSGPGKAALQDELGVAEEQDDDLGEDDPASTSSAPEDDFTRSRDTSSGSKSARGKMRLKDGDDRRTRRLAANRKSAQRSRSKRVEATQGLDVHVAKAQEELEHIKSELEVYRKRHQDLMAENQMLAKQLSSLTGAVPPQALTAAGAQLEGTSGDSSRPANGQRQQQGAAAGTQNESARGQQQAAWSKQQAASPAGAGSVDGTAKQQAASAGRPGSQSRMQQKQQAAAAAKGGSEVFDGHTDSPMAQQQQQQQAACQPRRGSGNTASSLQQQQQPQAAAAAATGRGRGGSLQGGQKVSGGSPPSQPAMDMDPTLAMHHHHQYHSNVPPHFLMDEMQPHLPSSTSLPPHMQMHMHANSSRSQMHPHMQMHAGQHQQHMLSSAHHHQRHPGMAGGMHHNQQGAGHGSPALISSDVADPHYTISTDSARSLSTYCHGSPDHDHVEHVGGGGHQRGLHRHHHDMDPHIKSLHGSTTPPLIGAHDLTGLGLADPDAGDYLKTEPFDLSPEAWAL